MRRWMTAVAALALLVACSARTTTLPGPSASAAIAMPTPASTSTAPAPPLNGPDDGAALEWTRFPGEPPMEYAALEVPRDHADPAGPALTVMLGRLPATDPAQRIGSIVYFDPDGPEASGIKQLRDNVAARVPAAVRERFDLVSFDARGTGSSVPRVDCGAWPELHQLDPSDAAAWSAWVDAIAAYAASCGAMYGDLLPHLGTDAVVGDLELIRAALGEPRLTFIGQSSGAAVGARYAERHPDRVRAMILDGPADLSGGLASVIADGAATQARLDRFLAWCGAEPSCAIEPGSGTRAAFEALMAGLAEEPIGQIDEYEAWVAVRRFLADGDWPDLQTMLTTGAAGRVAPFEGVVPERFGGRPIGFQYSAPRTCLDAPFPRDVEAFEAASEAARAVAPDFAWIPYLHLLCAFWPVEPQPLGEIDAAGAPPIVVIGSTEEATGGLDGRRGPVRAFADRLASGALVTFAAPGRSGLWRGDTCIDAVAEAYLLRQEVPADGTACP